MPFLDRDTGKIAENGWGNADDTADYVMRMVAEVCAKFGGDRENVVLTGFSRGAIACGYIGLRNDRIAALWKGFHACQHSDGAAWNGATYQEPSNAPPGSRARPSSRPITRRTSSSP